MKRRDFLRLAGAGALASLPRAIFSAPVRAAAPNFIFILVDDLGWTGLSVPSDPKVQESKSDFYRTPRLEQLARQGTTFSRAYAPAPMCTPSRAAFLTGKSPAQLHVTSPGRPRGALPYQKVIPPRHTPELPAKETAIAETLKQKDYVSAHFGKWHLAGGGPGAHGFEVDDGETANGGPGAYEDPNPKDIFGITKRAIAFMTAQVNAKRPFYMQLSHYAVHEPHLALKRTIAEVAKRRRGRRHRDITYAAMTQDLDTSVGMLLDKVEELGIADNTYIVFTSDNGAAGGRRARRLENTPLSGGKGTLREGGIRVPLICRGPGIRAGASRSQNVIGTDLFATFCEWAGIRTMPAGVESVSLVPLLTAEGTFRRVHEELVFHFPHYAKGPDQVPMTALIRGDYKLIRFYETGEMRLFNLAEDIGERKDLSSAMPDKANELAAKLDAYLKRVNAQLPRKNPHYDSKASRQDTGPRRRGKGTGFLGRFDKNKDGQVSRQEFTGLRRRFNRLDKNRDGYVDGKEIPARGGPR